MLEGEKDERFWRRDIGCHGDNFIERNNVFDRNDELNG